MAKVKDFAPSFNGHQTLVAEPTVLPFRAVTALQLRTMEVPPREWIVVNIIPRGLLSAIVAQSGSGKTWVMLDLARNLATGDMWAGKYLTRKSVVGILDLEGDYTGLQERWLALEAGHGRLSEEAAGRIFFLSDIGGVDVLDTAQAAAERIVESIKASGIEVLFVDTLSRTHQLDENSSDMRIVMITLEQIARDTGCTIILAHHAGKDGGRGGRGSSAIKDALQHEITLETIKDADGGPTGAKIGLTKAKSAPLIDRMSVLHIEQLADAAGVRLVYDNEGPKAGRPSKDVGIEGYLQRHLQVGRTRSQIVNSLVENAVCSASKAHTYISDALDDGRLVRDTDGNISLSGLLQK